jgi:hypothetical protein
MHLNIANSVRINGCFTQNLAEDGSLSSDVRSGDGLRLSRVVGVSAQNDTKNGIILSQCIVETLNDESRNTLTTAITISTVIKGLAVSSSREEVASIKTRREVRVRQDIGTACNGSVNVSAPERVASEMNTGKTGGASRVNRVTGTAELEEVVDAPGDKGTVPTRDEVSVNSLSAVGLHPIVAGHAVEDTNAIRSGRRRGIGDNASLLNSFVSSHESKSLSRINLRCLSGRDVEEASVKLGGIIEPAAEGSGTGVLALPSGIDVSLGIPSKTRDGFVDVETLEEKIPVGLVVLGAWESARHGHDGELGLLGSRLGAHIRNRVAALSMSGRNQRAQRCLLEGGIDEVIGSGSDGNNGELLRAHILKTGLDVFEDRTPVERMNQSLRNSILQECRKASLLKLDPSA